MSALLAAGGAHKPMFYDFGGGMGRQTPEQIAAGEPGEGAGESSVTLGVGGGGSTVASPPRRAQIAAAGQRRMDRSIRRRRRLLPWCRPPPRRFQAATLLSSARTKTRTKEKS